MASISQMQAKSLGKYLVTVLRRSELVTIFWDGESFCLDAVDRDGLRRMPITAETAYELFARAINGLPTRKCVRCKEEKLLSLFARNGNKRRGWCKSCETERVKEYDGKNSQSCAARTARDPLHSIHIDDDD